MWLTPERSRTFQLIKSPCLRKISFGMKWKQGLGNAAWPEQHHILDVSSPLHILCGEEASGPAGSLLENPPRPRVSPPPLRRPSAKGRASGRTLKLFLTPLWQPANTSAITVNVKQLPEAQWGRHAAHPQPAQLWDTGDLAGYAGREGMRVLVDRAQLL